MPKGYGARLIYILQNNWQNFLDGALTTLAIAIVGTLVGCLIGFIVGIIQTIPQSKKDNVFKKIILFIVKGLCTCYVELFRGTPMMVQAMFIYYGAMQYLNWFMSMWFAAFFIVSINTGAYMAETVRGGIISIDDGQTEGAKSIGMSHTQTMVYIILPQALRNILPQITNNLIINIKDTSVLSVIGVVELFFVSNQFVGSTYVYFETFTVTMAVYLVMTIASAKLLRLAEKKLAGPQNYELNTEDTLALTSGLYKFPDKKEAEK